MQGGALPRAARVSKHGKVKRGMQILGKPLQDTEGMEDGQARRPLASLTLSDRRSAVLPRPHGVKLGPSHGRDRVLHSCEHVFCPVSMLP